MSVANTKGVKIRTLMAHKMKFSPSTGRFLFGVLSASRNTPPQKKRRCGVFFYNLSVLLIMSGEQPAITACMYRVVRERGDHESLRCTLIFISDFHSFPISVYSHFNRMIGPFKLNELFATPYQNCLLPKVTRLEYLFIIIYLYWKWTVTRSVFACD